MVWGGVCHNWKTPLIFIEEGNKINQKSYLKMLKEKFLPSVKISKKPIGLFNMILLLHTKLTQCRIGCLKPDFIKYTDCGLPVHQILTPWISVFGIF